MKWIIASDIHGSELYCREVIKAFENENAQKILLLGDILYHGPRNELPQGHNPKAVISILNEYKNKILCVRGNCDAEVDQMVLEFPIMSDYALICQDGITIYATHGHIYGEDNPPPLSDGNILLCGHTHVSALRNHGKFTYMNPGSASIPKENTHHGYMTFENGIFIWKDFDGNEIMSYQHRNL